MENTTTNETIPIPKGILLETYNDKMLTIQLPAIVYIAVLMIIGIPGNGVVIYVYFLKWRRSSSRMFILFLALFDLIYCLTVLPMEIYTMRYSVMMDKPLLCKVFRFSTYSMNSSSALVLLGIAVDRFRRICRPYKRTFSEQVSKYICIGAVLISITLTSPSVVLYGTREVAHGSVIGKFCLIENKFDSSKFPIVFMGMMGLMTFAIFTALSVLYYCVGIQIYKHRQFKMKRCSHVVKFRADNATEKSSHNEKPDTDDAKHVNEHVSEAVNGTVMKYDKDNMQLELSCKTDAYCENGQQFESPKHSPEHNNAQDALVGDDTSVKHAKKPLRRVRYLLVRGSSSMTSSGRTKCVNCLTVRVGKSTFMLFLITLAYIISFLPFYTIIIVRQTTEGFVQRLSTGGYMAYHVFLRSYLFASAINPIIYSFCNPQFRGHCINLFKRIFMGKTELSESIFKRRAR